MKLRISALVFLTLGVLRAASVVSALTYLGGSGIDAVQAIAADPQGNLVVAGITGSANFPGAGALPTGAMSIFVAKLNSTATSILFTTVLGSNPNENPLYPLESVSSLVVDKDGSIYLTGQTYAQNFPTTPGAWRQGGSGAFVARLDGAGKIVYSTFLGPQTWGLSPRRILARNGIAYLAGNFSSAEFLGTAGAIQRGLAGNRDFFVLGMTADGSGPIFATAFGGSGNETLNDMAIDAAGNIALVGISASQDFPSTADALPYRAPPNGASAGVLVRISANGSTLISSTFLGTSAAAAVTGLPDGGIAIAGGSALPGDIAAVARYSINIGSSGGPSYLAKFPAGSNRPVWVADLVQANSFSAGICADAAGNLYWVGYPAAMSGGALGFYTGPGISELAADGSRLLYASPLFNTSVGNTTFVPALFAATASAVYAGGSTAIATLPVTPGAVQPQRDPAPTGTYQAPLNGSDGYAGVLDLSSFSAGNFFATPSQYGTPSLSWRIGEPAPAPLVQAIQLSGDAGQLTATPSSRLTSSYSSSPSPAVSINVNTTQSVAGTFTESVAVQSQSNLNSVLTLPVALTIAPQVSFALAAGQVTIHYRQGQARTATKIAIAPNFGSESFSFTVSSSVNWLYGGVDQSDRAHPVLSITTADKTPGTYDGVLTVGLQNLHNANQVVQVHYIIDAPATIQVSRLTITLHVVKGQPITPAVAEVTGSVPGVAWGVWIGVSRTWLQITTTTAATPGEIQVTVDPASVEVGYWAFSIAVNGEAGQSIPAAIYVDVSSGAPLDATPSSISYQYMRGGPYQYQSQLVTLTAPIAAAVRWAADQPWIQGPAITTTTPAGLYFNFDNTLAEGVYQGKITVTAGSNNIVIPVTWMLYDVPHLVFPVDPIGFQWRVGDPPPAVKQLQITCPTLKPDFVDAGPTDRPSFLNVSPSYGATPLTLNLSADPTGLAPGVYKTNLAIRGNYPDSKQYPWIPVTFTILPAPNPPKANVTRVVDAASKLAGAVSPGELVLISGSGLGPVAPVISRPGSGGLYPTSLAGWTVYFDAIPAPVLYVSDTQSAVIAPFGIAGKVSTTITVVAGGTTSLGVAAPVGATNPSVFTADYSGSGIAAAIDTGGDGSTSVVTSATPALRGDIATIFATGLGVTTPALPDGSLAAQPLATLNTSVRVSVGGVATDALSAGPAAGQVAGLMAIRFRIPQNAPTGSVPLVVIAGENPSQAGVTLALR